MLGRFVVVGVICAVLGGVMVGMCVSFTSTSVQVRAETAAGFPIKPPIASAATEPMGTKACDSKSAESGSLTGIRGRTQALPGHSAQITPTVLHPVVRVLVVPGQQVEKGQALVELERHGPEADVRARRAEVEELAADLARFKALPRAELQAEARAQLEDAQVALKAATERLERAKKLHDKGALPEGEFLALETAELRAKAEVRADEAHLQHLLKQPVEEEIAELTARVAAAQAKMDSDTEELEHHTVCAPINGIVEWLNVQPGVVTRPGLAVWGEIYDLSEIDVRAELTLAQIRKLESIADPTVEVVVDGWPERTWKAKIVFVGKVADANSGLIPIVARVADAGGKILCKVPVTIKLVQPAAKTDEPKPAEKAAESAPAT